MVRIGGEDVGVEIEGGKSIEVLYWTAFMWSTDSWSRVRNKQTHDIGGAGREKAGGGREDEGKRQSQPLFVIRWGRGLASRQRTDKCMITVGGKEDREEER